MKSGNHFSKIWVFGIANRVLFISRKKTKKKFVCGDIEQET